MPYYTHTCALMMTCTDTDTHTHTHTHTHQHAHVCAQAFQQYIAPTMMLADIVVPRGAENQVAMQLIVHHVKDQLEKVQIETVVGYGCFSVALSPPSSSLSSPLHCLFLPPSSTLQPSLPPLPKSSCPLSLFIIHHLSNFTPLLLFLLSIRYSIFVL